MEKLYIGLKFIAAEPMDELTFSNTVRLLHDMEIGPDGRGRPGYKVRYVDGYVSWSPKDTFEFAYREITPEEKSLIGGE